MRGTAGERGGLGTCVRGEEGKVYVCRPGRGIGRHFAKKKKVQFQRQNQPYQ